MKNIFKFIVEFPKIVLFLSIILSVVFGFFSLKLEIDASTQTLLLDNDKELSIWRDISKRYKSPNFLVIAYTPKDDLLSQKTLAKIDKISNQLLNLSSVKSVFSVLNAPLLQNKDIPLSDLIKHIPTLKDEDINQDAAKFELLNSPLYKNNLVSSDFKTTAIVINLYEDEKYDEFLQKREYLKEKEANSTINKFEKIELSNLNKEFKKYRDEIRIKEHKSIEDIRAILAENRGDEILFLGGINMIADDMISYVKNDLYTYGAAALLLLMLCLWLFFRQMRFVMIPVLVCFVSTILASGLFGLLKFEITVISSNYIALQLIITISVVIHLITGYRELYLRHPNYSQKRLVYLALRSRANPCFFAVFTTVVGFVSLCFSDIKPIIMLGIMMSVGVSVSLIVAFVVFGSSTMLLSKKDPKCNFENSFKLTLWCANFAIKDRKTIYIFSILLLIFGLYGISKLKIENSFIGYFKEDTEIYKGMQVIDTKLGGTVPIDIIIKFKDQTTNQSGDSKEDAFDDFESEFKLKENDHQYWFSVYKMDIVKKVDRFLQNYKFIGNVSSLGTLLEVGKGLNKGEELDSLSLALLYNGLPEQYKQILLTPYISIQDNEVHFIARTIDSSKDLRRDEFIKTLQNSLALLLKDDNVEVSVHGVMVLYNNMLQSLITSQTSTFGFAVLALFLIFVFIFKSVKLSLIGIVSNLIPLCAVFGVMGIAGIPLDIMSITIAAISLGIGVDDIIHYVHRYKIELRTKDRLSAIKAAHTSIGYAMQYTSFAIFLGFSVMCFSNFWPTIYFGFLTDLVMFMMLGGALLLLPSLIISFYFANLKKE
ncbi:efflux RND transporter permease subunit [Campylobacter hyointestinalis]|uniref:efflux RND transporter permease subunit n=1 Tax=Campylobacter hyointestinalis TaxID=198 RepID=UPI002555B6C4|nr:MMPL family transporter [Campylobacter hyointestinalis]MDL2346490.1 MMPL family transporter [Campylobacter hyointestinalis]MDL2348229.1 MMPL family transporter [Campylobacter hyointestinalis]MDL2349975.1 MMPL family transporter [Campylobacter hyointestinalis]MDM1025348.1 MMPL family transporter [Campylobacter hyointestinalis]MDM1027984.1 MMPL family transporter [Campylobacter hyointestinalis]